MLPAPSPRRVSFAPSQKPFHPSVSAPPSRAPAASELQRRPAPRAPVDVFVQAPRAAASTANTLGAPSIWSSDATALKAVSPDRPWSSLNPAQRGLFGAEGERGYRALSDEQRELVLFLSERLIANGIDLVGMRLQRADDTTRPNRVLFSPDSPGFERFQAQLEAGEQRGRFSEDDVFGLFHPGMSETGYREERRKFSMQIGIGDKGAFVDVDRYHPWKGVRAWLGHFLEIVTPGKPDVDDMARAIAG